MPRKPPKSLDLLKPYRVQRGKGFRLRDFDPADTHGLNLEAEADDLLAESVARLSDMQDKLYAQDRWALLLIFQAMDAAGKDSIIGHVMSGVNPQGCEVYSFKQPSAEELSHDFLWRASKVLPQRGHIGIFNRSYYEDVLVVRVHAQLLSNERVPPILVTKRIWRERFKDIVAFESHLHRNGTVVRKFFLNVSKKEQKQRFLKRLDEPDKNWKFSEDDVRERERWDDYMDAYDGMIRHTATEEAPWFVVPADNKWFTRLVVASVINDTLTSLKLAYPKIDKERQAGLKSARKLLLDEG
ncbi:MAG TPA: polyphosphate kinase 2 family protein [Bryobacteraceae bacterium]|jgi:PPK2 family polyphosphate:nucleotide phosphotransferase